MSTFIKLLPLQLDDVKEYREPGMALEEKDHIVGDMSDSLKKLWTLWKQYQYGAAELRLKMQCGEQEVELGKIREMEAKSEVLRDIFWIAIYDELELWDKSNVGVRKGFKVVWSEKQSPELPPFIRGIMGMNFE